MSVDDIEPEMTDDEVKAFHRARLEYAEQKMKVRGPFPRILLCPDPDNCDEEHNEIYGWQTDPERMHHYGCECDDCCRYYYLKLK